VNKATVDILNARGFKITYTRCLPHCISLVVKAFTSVIDEKFKVATNLKKFRSFLTAGGGVARKLLALEYGIAVSGVDFADTRWASFVAAILYIANPQKAKDLKAANERLQELKDAGDETAAAALAAPVTEMRMFNVIYQFLESITEESLESRKASDSIGEAEASLPAIRTELLEFFSSQEVFATFAMIDLVLGGDSEDGVEALPSLMKITQGDARFASKLTSRETGTVPVAADAARNLINSFARLDFRWSINFEAPIAADDAAAVEKRGVQSRLRRLYSDIESRMQSQVDASYCLFAPQQRGRL